MKRWLPWLWPIGFAALELVRQLFGDTTWWSFWVLRLSEPVWLGLALVGLAMAGFRRFRRFRWPAATAVAVAVAMIAPVFPTRARGRPDIKVLQLNMEHGLEGVDRVADLIRRENPDVICLQEAGPLSYYPKQTPPRLAEVLSGYRVFHSLFEAIAVKGELLSTEIIHLPEASHEKASVNQKVITAVRARMQGREVRVATVHFSPRPDPRAGFVAGATAFAEVRRGQFARLAEYIDSDTAPTIVCGDFNSHPVGPNYRSIRAKMTDAFAEAGLGLGYSLRSNFPHKRIDYIFVRGFGVNDCKVLTDFVSDHRALVGLLIWDLSNDRAR